MPKTLLLADDSVTIQKVVGITFANEDIELVTENNGDAALSRAREIVPDIVLADVSMPGLNGYELCASIRNDARLSHIPVILLTGTFEVYDEAKTREVGANGHIAKPFEAQLLVDLVQRALGEATPTGAPAAPAASDPAQTLVIQPGEHPATPSEPLEFADFQDSPPPSGEATKVMGLDLTPMAPDPAPASSPLITPKPQSPPPLLPSIAPLPSSGPPTPSSAAGPVPPGPQPASETAPGGDTDVDSVLYEETAFLDPRVALSGPDAPTPLPQLPSAGPPLPEIAPPPEPPRFPEGRAPKLEGILDPGQTEREADTSPGPDPASRSDDTPRSGRFGAEAPARELVLEDMLLPKPEINETSMTQSMPEPEPPMIDAEPASMPSLDAIEPVATPEALPEEQMAVVAEPVPEPEVEPFMEGELEPLAPTNPMLEAEPEPDTGDVDTGVVDVAAAQALPAPLTAAEPSPALSEAALRAALEKVAWDAFGPLTEQLVREAVRKIEEVAWEVVPVLAEKLIREEIDRIKKGD